jgi:arginine deiminase
MKALEKTAYNTYEVSAAFNKIILDNIESYDGKKKQQLKSFLEDLQRSGCICGMIGAFIYHTDCKAFYMEHLEDLENIKDDLEDSFGEPIPNRYKLPHYTFMCWLCFEEYCYNIYCNVFQ